MIKFILNNKEVATDLPAGMQLLDFVRYHKHLTGTKIGCREGDCGACTVLIGELKEMALTYRSFTSCLTPLGNVHGRHVVTIEGLNMEGLNPLQQAMSDCSATQCGFCTPGIVVSLAAYCLGTKEATQQHAIAAIDGNICRCTGYKSIERAAARVTAILAKNDGLDPLTYAVTKKILPAYFAGIKERLQHLLVQLNGTANLKSSAASLMGGGTDLYVQRHDEFRHDDIRFMYIDPSLRSIKQVGDTCVMGPSVTVTDLQESAVFKECFPHFSRQVKSISSTPIRNMATIAGNFINASPIGDFTIFFLAADAMLTLSDGEQTRELPLRKLYQGYKQLNKRPEEHILAISFTLPAKNTKVNFEKVSKRTHLDIASVNSTLFITLDDEVVTHASLSAGGVGPVPAFLGKASAFLQGKIISEELVADTIKVAQAEITPVSDVRGSAEYKTMLLGQLIKAHFLTLFPQLKFEKLMQVV